jgi:hypothetical protein
MMQQRGVVVIESMRLERTEDAGIRLVGTVSSMSAQAEFARQLDEIHAEVVKAKCASFTVDVRALGFANSSSIRVFVNWISRAKASGYKLVFLTDRSITWHRLSFAVLKSIAPDVVEIIEAKPGAMEDGGRAP